MLTFASCFSGIGSPDLAAAVRFVESDMTRVDETRSGDVIRTPDVVLGVADKFWTWLSSHTEGTEGRK